MRNLAHTLRVNVFYTISILQATMQPHMLSKHAMRERPRTRLSGTDRARLCTSVDFLALLAEDGIEVSESRRGLWCRMRKEETPSCRIYRPDEGKLQGRGWTWHDFGSGERGDALGYLTDVRGMGYVEAMRLLEQLVGDRLPGEAGRRGRQKRGPAAKTSSEPPILAEHEQQEACAAFVEALDSACPGNDAAAVEYLLGRGITESVSRSMAWPCSIPDAEAAHRVGARLAKHEKAELLRRAGLLTESRNGNPRTLWWDRTVLLFSLDRSGGWPLFAIGRRFDFDRMPAKYVNQGGAGGAQRVLFGLPSLVAAGEGRADLVICEGAIDALAAHSLGVHAVATLSRPGTGDLDALFGAHVEDLRECRRVLVLPDRETTPGGRAAAAAGAAAIAGWLRARLVPVHVTSMRALGFDDAKDLGEAAEGRAR